MADAYWKGGVDPELAPFSGYAHGMVAGAPAPPPRAPFYSFRAIFVPKVPSAPPPARRTFGRRLRTAMLIFALPSLAGAATYAALTHRAPAPSYVFVANSTPQPIDLVVDGVRRGSVDARGSTRLDLPIGPHVITALAGPSPTLVDEATVQLPAAGSRVLFNIGGAASVALVTRGYGASPVDRVQPVPAGRVVSLPPEVVGESIDQPFPATVTASEGQAAVTVTHLCAYDPAKRRVGCQDR